MILKKKNRFKPLYKQFPALRENVQSRSKILKFKKQKWEKLIQNYKRKLKRYKKFKPQDQNQYLVSKYPSRATSYQKRFKNTLQAAKRFRLFYGDLSKKFLKHQVQLIHNSATKNHNLAFLEVFESRLDIVLYRAKLSPSIRNSRQLIAHGKIFVNEKIVKTKSYVLKAGDIISVDSTCSQLIETNIKRSQTWPIPPKHLFVNYKTMQIIFGNVKNTNIASNFSFNLNLEKILINYPYQ